MARRSGRLSSGGDSAAKHKRAASGSFAANSGTKRTKQQATPKKSQYFADAEDANGQDVDMDEEDEIESTEETASEFGEDDDEDAAVSDPEDEDEDEDGSDDATPRKKTTPKSATKGAEVWRPGVKTGLGPGKQVVIKKPKARPAGKTPYTDETIHQNTLLFLKDLKDNNDRQWLKLYDSEFRQAENDWKSFVEKMTEKLTEIDETIPELPVKDVIFRIYRDVRFSKDPTPYKPWFSVAWSRTGRKSTYSHYYLQLQPNGGSFVGGGCWHPEAGPVAAMRRQIDRNPQRLKAVLTDEQIRKEFLDGVGKSDAAAVKAFVKSNGENALKTRPKGYDADHQDIDLLRLRNYTIGRKLSDDEVLGEGGSQRIAELLQALKPFITYLNSVVMPDDAESESEDEEEGQDGEEEDSSESAQD